MNTSTTIINNDLDNLLHKFNSADKFISSFKGGKKSSKSITDTTDTDTDNLTTLNLNNYDNIEENDVIIGGNQMDEKTYLKNQIDELIQSGGSNEKTNTNTNSETIDDKWIDDQLTKITTGGKPINDSIDQNINTNNESDNKSDNKSDNESDNESDDESGFVGGKKKKKLIDINREVDDLHIKAIEKIKEIMKCTDDEAAIYKSVVYRLTKAENPDLKSLDRAKKMFDYINKKFLKDVDLAAETEKRIKEQEENAAKPKEPKSSKKSSKKSKKSSKKTEKSIKKNVSDEIEL